MANPVLKRLRTDFSALLEKYKRTSFPNVDVIMVSTQLDTVLGKVEQINAQTANIGKVIIATNSFTDEDQTLIGGLLTKGIVEFVDLPEQNVSLGAKYNIAISHAVSDYVAVVTDEDIYHPNYLLGQLATMYTEKTILIGKANPTCYDPVLDKRGFYANTYLRGYNRRSLLGSIVFRRDVHERVDGFDTGSDFAALFLVKAMKQNILLSDGLPFNYEHVLSPNEDTWMNTKLNFRDVRINSMSVDDIIV